MEMERAMGKLTNKNILITGGTRGIGLASAQEFEREGARVVICGTDEKTLKEARSTLGPNALAFRADVSKLSDLDSLYAKIKTELGHLDVVFVNAGYSQSGPFESVEEATFDNLVAANLNAERGEIARLAVHRETVRWTYVVGTDCAMDGGAGAFSHLGG